jgi:ComF family protein
MNRAVYELLCDLVAPPRATERIVRSLTLEDLQALHQDDALPYRDERVRALVWEVKYYANRRARELCGAFLAEPLLDLAQESLGAPLFIPVPMHAARKKERGHNQTELLCEAALPHLGDSYEYAPMALVRTATRQQQGLPKHTRRTNVRHSMHVSNEKMVRGRTCIVLDDVRTTGATLEEAARALKVAGASSVECLALARTF